jgi:hypothetical protein
MSLEDFWIWTWQTLFLSLNSFPRVILNKWWLITGNWITNTIYTMLAFLTAFCFLDYKAKLVPLIFIDSRGLLSRFCNERIGFIHLLFKVTDVLPLIDDALSPSTECWNFSSVFWQIPSFIHFYSGLLLAHCCTIIFRTLVALQLNLTL